DVSPAAPGLPRAADRFWGSAPREGDRGALVVRQQAGTLRADLAAVAIHVAGRGGGTPIVGNLSLATIVHRAASKGRRREKKDEDDMLAHGEPSLNTRHGSRARSTGAGQGPLPPLGNIARVWRRSHGSVHY